MLLSGEQIASYTNANVTFPGGTTNIELQGVSTLGDADSRFFLVRTTGDTDLITNGQNFAVYPAVDDGSGNLVPGPAPIISATFATPDAYNDTGAGDSYLIFGLFGGSQYAVNLDGFSTAPSATFIQGQDVSPGGDGEISISEIEAANPDAAICFARGTLICTPGGEVPVETLTIGAKVTIPGAAPKPVRWIASQRIRLQASNLHLAPIRIRRDALGPGLPRRDLVVSPNHRIVHSSPQAQLWFDTPSVLVPAKFLVDGETVLHETGWPEVEYWHFLFDDHEVVLANGLPTESLHLGNVALTGLTRAMRAELFEIFPQLTCFVPRRSRTRYPTLRRYEACALVSSERPGPSARDP